MTKSRAPGAVALLTAAWVLAVLGLLWWCFAIGMEQWAAQGAASAERDHRGAVAALTLAGVAVGGLALIAAVAFAGEMPRTGAVYVVLAVVTGALALPLAANAGRTLTPAPTAPPGPTVCQEHSGSDTRCPGG